METSTGSYWQTGFNILNNLATSGAFGSDGQRVANYVNPPTAIAQPAAAPPPPPVAGQQAVNPPASSGGFVDHMRANWSKYALGLGTLFALVFVVKMARK